MIVESFGLLFPLEISNNPAAPYLQWKLPLFQQYIERDGVHFCTTTCLNAHISYGQVFSAVYHTFLMSIKWGANQIEKNAGIRKRKIG